MKGISKEINCYVNTIQEWKYIKSKFKNYKRNIFSTSPEIILNESINDKKIVIDKIISKKTYVFSKDFGKLSNNIFYKARNLNYSHNFSIQLSLFILRFSRITRAALPLKKFFFSLPFVIVESIYRKGSVYKKLGNPYLRIFKGEKKLIIKKKK